MPSVTRRIALLLALGWTAAPANGQAIDSSAVPSVRLVPGAELRVWERDHFKRLVWKRVAFNAWSADTIIGTHIVTGTSIRLLPDSVPRIDLMVGRESRQSNILIGGGLGFVIGTALGYAFLSVYPFPCNSMCPSDAQRVAAAMIGGGMPVGVGGALIASAFPAPKKWKTIRPEPVARPRP